jgi:hypothetical protein
VAAWVRRTHHGGEPRERPAAAARGEEGGAREEGPRVGVFNFFYRYYGHAVRYYGPKYIQYSTRSI